MSNKNPVAYLRHGVFAFLLLAATAIDAPGQSIVSGKVFTLDSAAIAAAHVSLHDGAGTLKGETVTDSLGNFTFRIANITAMVTLYLSVVSVGFTSIEFVPVKVAVSEEVAVQVLMHPTTVPLAPVTVLARPRNLPATLHDYYDKLEDARRGTGHGLDRKVMERYAGLELIKALQNVPGVEDGRSILPEGVTLTVPKMREGCIPLTFLDRMPIQPEQLAVMDPGELEGVLVYVGGQQVPSDFSQLTAGVECGMILAYRVAPDRRRSSKSLVGILLILGAFSAFAAGAGW